MSALDVQEGGSHYKDMKIQPVEFIKANDIPFLEGNVIKYVTRHKAKNGKADLLKAIHYLELLMEFDYPEKLEQVLVNSLAPETPAPEVHKTVAEKLAESKLHTKPGEKK